MSPARAEKEKGMSVRREATQAAVAGPLAQPAWMCWVPSARKRRARVKPAIMVCPNNAITPRLRPEATTLKFHNNRGGAARTRGGRRNDSNSLLDQIKFIRISMICPTGAISRVQLEGKEFEMVSDPDKCIGCGFCANACPCGVWSYVPNTPLE